MANWLDIYQVPDFLSHVIKDPVQKTIGYTLIFCVIGLIQAVLVKRKLYIEKPQNTINIMIAIGIIILITRFKGITTVAQPYIMLSYIVMEMIAHKLFPIEKAVIYILEPDKQNITVEEYVFYSHSANLCVALQDNRSVIKRLLFNKHVTVEVNACTTWTENYKEQLWLCNSYEIAEKRIQETEIETGIKARIHKWLLGETQVVMRLDVIEAHEVNRFDLMMKTKILDNLVERYEKLGIAFTRLRTLLTALLIRKQQKVLLSALHTFEDSVTISDKERDLIRGIVEDVEKEKAKLKEEATSNVNKTE